MNDEEKVKDWIKSEVNTAVTAKVDESFKELINSKETAEPTPCAEEQKKIELAKLQNNLKSVGID